MPSWIASVLPPWIPGWVANFAFGVILNQVLPRLARQFPKFSLLIYDVIAFLHGDAPSPELKGAAEHFHALKSARPAQT